MKAIWILFPFLAAASMAAQALEVNEQINIARAGIQCRDVQDGNGYGSYGYGDPDLDPVPRRIHGDVTLELKVDGQDLALDGRTTSCEALTASLGSSTTLPLILIEKDQAAFGDVVSTTLRFNLGNPAVLVLTGTTQN